MQFFVGVVVFVACGYVGVIVCSNLCFSLFCLIECFDTLLRVHCWSRVWLHVCVCALFVRWSACE